jgi:hypothetical protein
MICPEPEIFSMNEASGSLYTVFWCYACMKKVTVCSYCWKALPLADDPKGTQRFFCQRPILFCALIAVPKKNGSISSALKGCSRMQALAANGDCNRWRKKKVTDCVCRVLA